MNDWSTPAAKAAIDKTIAALAANGIEAELVANVAQARARVVALVPAGAEVFTQVSMTLEATGIATELNGSGRYASVRNTLNGMNPQGQGREMRRLGAAPDVTVGSVHAVTQTGTVIVASLTGSQLPGYAYGAGTVIWVVGAQKIVKDVEEGMRRITEHVVGLESVRARKAYGLPDSFSTFPSKVLLFNREVQPGRVKMIIVNESLGF